MKLHLLFPLLSLPLLAQPEFDRVLQSNMVLQRGAQVPVFGTDKPGTEVSVSWKGTTKTAKTDAKGKWSATFDSGEADAAGSSITATDKSGSATLDNVLVGDVWLASGQSNMAFMIQQAKPGPTKMSWDLPNVRLFKVQCLLHTQPGAYSVEQYNAAKEKDFFTFTWEPCNMQTIKNFSAVASYFASRVQKEENVPVGIICNAVGGSGIESWTPTAVLNKAPLYASIKGDKWQTSDDFDAWMRGRAKENLKNVVAAGEKNLVHPFAPGLLYENATAPLTEMPIKGVIWYQGESNADDPVLSRNVQKMKLMITAWRKAFKNENLPFLMVQLPRIIDPKRPHWGTFRNVQKAVADSMPGVELICTVDLGSANSNVHPPVKEEVGFRLADEALRTVYGKEKPTYPAVTKSIAAKNGSKITITFSEPLKTTDSQAPRGFEVAKKPEGPFTAPKSVTIDGAKVILETGGAGTVWQYNEGTALDPNLVSEKSGLPAFPARSYQDKKVNRSLNADDRTERAG